MKRHRGLRSLLVVGLGLAACSANAPRDRAADPATTAGTTTPDTRPTNSSTAATAVAPVPAPITTAVPATAVTTTTPPTSAPPAPTTTTVVPVPSPSTSACISTLAVRELAGLVTWPAAYGDRLGAARDLVTNYGLGGVILMTAPAAGDEPLLASMHELAPRGLTIATDEEGGLVQRLRSYGALPSARVVGTSMTAAEVRAMVAEHGRVIRALGIDMVLGPVVDVDPVAGDGPLGDRVISSDPARVGEIGGAYVQGWLDAGIVPVLKHFPGHGSASADTHKAAASTPPLDELLARDLQPYRQLAASGAGVMVGHLLVPGLSASDRRPASLDPALVDGLLRHDLGINPPIVLSDALEMRAVSAFWSLPAAAVESLRAGVDVVIFSAAQRTGEVIDAIEAAVTSGALTLERLQQAATRVADLHRWTGDGPCPAGA